MKLYHGSNISINHIDLSKGHKGKDFGQGFYLSANKEQAFLMAKATVAKTEYGKPCITTFEFDEKNLYYSRHRLSLRQSPVFEIRLLF